MAQTVVVSFFQYQGVSKKWQALGRMGRPALKTLKVQGLTFWKALGTGSGNGFSIWPDWSTYGLFSVFDSEKNARQFLASKTIAEYEAPAKAHSHILMHTIKAHGEWSRQKPFNSCIDYDTTKPLAVITRATIKPQLALKFWRHVPSVSKSMDHHQDLIYSKGIGEWSILMQATFSLWNTGDAMMAYAYQNEKHAEMIKKTRELSWYSEELFSRFHPFEIQGDLINLDI